MNGRNRARLPGRGEIVGGLYVLAMVAVAAVAAWPIYGSAPYAIVAGVSCAAAFGVVTAGHVLRWHPRLVAGSLVGVYVVLGATVAVPAARDGPAGSLWGLATGIVTGWKDLVSVDMPVGSYRNLLVPALVVFLAGTAGALALVVRASGRREKPAFGTIVVLLAMQAFGLAFGSDATPQPWLLGPVAVAAPREALLGAASLVLTLGWLAWRAAGARGATMARRRVAAGVRAAAVAGGLVAAALTVSGVVAPVMTRGDTRQVLRSSTGPDLRLAKAVSPLSGYRSYFTDAAFDRELFRVVSDGPLPERIRLATLSYDDQAAFQVSDPSSGARFRRVPFERPERPGRPVTLTITSSGQGTMWAPMAGDLQSVSFGGPRARDLADGFYYDPDTASAVDTVPGGLSAGDTYTIRARITDEAGVASLASPGAPAPPGMPPGLVAWVQEQGQPADGQGLAELAARLRARGYLSHALVIPTDRPPKWTTALPGHQPKASTAGHSHGRIDQLFAALLDGDTAAAGDDEQFAVAIALMARQLGFPSRVVMGARLSGPGPPGVPACVGGVCRGANMAAWAEAQGADGRWAAIDATPQHLRAPDETTRTQSLPRNATNVRPHAVSGVAPPDAAGAGGDTPRGPQAGREASLVMVWRALRVTGLGLSGALIVVGPLLVIVMAKAARRRARRRHGSATSRVAGAWDDYVDRQLDRSGHRAGTRRTTRLETAQEYDTPTAWTLAQAADRAVFSGEPTPPQAVRDAWSLVDRDRHAHPRRLRTALSLASLLRRDHGDGSRGHDARRKTKDEPGQENRPPGCRTRMIAKKAPNEAPHRKTHR